MVVKHTPVLVLADIIFGSTFPADIKMCYRVSSYFVIVMTRSLSFTPNSSQSTDGFILV